MKRTAVQTRHFSSKLWADVSCVNYFIIHIDGIVLAERIYFYILTDKYTLCYSCISLSKISDKSDQFNLYIFEKGTAC